MIKWFRFKNFQSYREECFVDLTVNKKVANSYYDYEMKDGTKVAKVLGIFGANGSGKSSLIKPLSFLSWFVPNSIKALDDKDMIPLFPHFSSKDKNTEMEIAFYFGENETESSNVEFKYFVELNDQRVIKEELKIKTSRLYSSIFIRTFKNGKYTVKRKNNILPIKLGLLEQAPKNCSLISYVVRMISQNRNEGDPPSKLADVIAYYFHQISSNLNLVGRNNSIYSIEDATEIFFEDETLFDRVKKILLRYDLGLTDIKIQEIPILMENGKDEMRLVPFCIHENEEATYRLPIFLESSGTQSAYKLLATIAESLARGGVAVLDEFDNDLHPQLTTEIINLFKDESTNPENAQLIFTSHSPEILKLLRKQHVYLTEKNDCESEAWRADEVEGLKERDNLYAKYISGALGGVPSFD